MSGAYAHAEQIDAVAGATCAAPREASLAVVIGNALAQTGLARPSLPNTERGDA